MFDLRAFGLTDMLECSSELRRLGDGASSMEGAAGEVVRYLYTRLIDKQTEKSALAMVRLYKTHRFDELEADLQDFARAQSPGGRVAPEAPCLTLLATAGDEEDWNDRRLSRSHRAIPLHNPAAVAALPMVYQLTRELGFDESDLLRPDPELFWAVAGRPGGVFYIPDARGSPYVPAQSEFVERYGIRSVIGFGGALPSGYVFAVIMFATVEISRETADVFGSLAFAAQLALLPFVERRLFESDQADDSQEIERDLRLAQAETAALGHLLDTRQHIVTEQAARLEQARREAEDRAEALGRSQRRLEQSEATKAAILNAALDCIITMDEHGRVVDFNPAAERTFGYQHDKAVGRNLADLIIPPGLRDSHRAGLDHFRRTGEGNILGKRIEVTAQRADGTEFPVELEVAAVEAGGAQLFSGHVRDITHRIKTERDLRAAVERYGEIARILQASLLPPQLPAIAGIDIASAYQPGHEGLDVGGDFYDMFEVGDRRWGVVLGDVMGKGAEAAATTALARHTVRAAAMAADHPGTVLALLNEALYRSDEDRFCTAAFGFLDTAEGVRLSLASGGHPPALLRSGSGVVELAASGTILGPFHGWKGTDIAVDLGAGDLVLLYSDGVTEARRGNEEFGMERLQATLRASGGAGAADTILAITEAIAGFASHRSDDLAMLAVKIA